MFAKAVEKFKIDGNVEEYKLNIERLDFIQDIIKVRRSIFGNDNNDYLGKEFKQKIDAVPEIQKKRVSLIFLVRTIMSEINIIDDFYIPLQTQEEAYSNKKYKLLVENDIDPAELVGLKKDANSSVIKLGEEQEGQKEDLYKEVLDYAAALPKDLLISVVRGGVNGFDFIKDLQHLLPMEIKSYLMIAYLNLLMRGLRLKRKV